jgi:hypothetical protein
MHNPSVKIWGYIKASINEFITISSNQRLEVIKVLFVFSWTLSCANIYISGPKFLIQL